MRTAASAGFGALEVAMRRDGGAKQLFPSTAIARRTLAASFAAFGQRRSTGKVGKALEIAHVTQGALQSLCRPVQVLAFAPAPQRDSFRQCFKHIAEPFNLDPQPVTARRPQSLQAVPLADQPLVPAVEFAGTIGLQGFRVLAPLITLQPRSLSDPARHGRDQALRPSGTQAAHQAAVVLRLALFELFADHGLRPCAVSLAACIFHDDIAVAGGAERAIQPGNFLLQAPPFRIGHDRRKERHGGAQPRDRDPDLMHGLGIAGARARVMGLDGRDAAERHLLECGCAIESRHFSGIWSAGRPCLTVSHLQCSPGTASKETRALCSDWSGVPEASIICQSTAPIAKVSCFSATSRVASDASPLRPSIRANRVARSAVRNRPTKRTPQVAARSAISVRSASCKYTASSTTEQPWARTRCAALESMP